MVQPVSCLFNKTEPHTIQVRKIVHQPNQLTMCLCNGGHYYKSECYAVWREILLSRLMFYYRDSPHNYYLFITVCRYIEHDITICKFPDRYQVRRKEIKRLRNNIEDYHQSILSIIHATTISEYELQDLLITCTNYLNTRLP
jgi:hypothetical protein